MGGKGFEIAKPCLYKMWFFKVTKMRPAEGAQELHARPGDSLRRQRHLLRAVHLQQGRAQRVVQGRWPGKKYKQNILVYIFSMVTIYAITNLQGYLCKMVLSLMMYGYVAPVFWMFVEGELNLFCYFFVVELWAPYSLPSGTSLLILF